ncbi:MAG: hypothetical protein ACOYMA_18570 [Bacteroidia bacterium]
MTQTNWNLKKSNILLLIIFVYSNCFAQKNTISKLNFYATIGTVFNGSINTSTSNNIASGTQTYSVYQDSIAGKETWRLNFSPQIGIIYQMNKNIDLQCGLAYLVLGHQRQLNNLQFESKTFPGIGTGLGNGVIIDKTNVERNINLNYRYHYLNVPILLNYHLNFRALSPKVKVSLSVGVGLNVLLKHDINAVLSSGFKIDEKSSFSIDSTGYSSKVFTTNIMLGTLVDYNYSKKVKFVFQPMLGFFPLSVSNKDLEARPWFVNLNLGLIYTLDLLKK